MCVVYKWYGAEVSRHKNALMDGFSNLSVYRPFLGFMACHGLKWTVYLTI